MDANQQLRYSDVQWNDQVGFDVPMKRHPEGPAMSRRSHNEEQCKSSKNDNAAKMPLTKTDQHYRLFECRDWIINLEGWIAHGCRDLEKEKEQMSLHKSESML